jgi:Phosphatidylinositolglycan class N (PIG-N)
VASHFQVKWRGGQSLVCVHVQPHRSLHHSPVPRSDQTNNPCRFPALASLFPFFITAPRTAEGRLLSYFLSFCPCFVILSIRAEGLFYLSYCATLYMWTLVEEDARRSEKANYQSTTSTASGGEYGSGWNPRRLSRDDVRIALFFLFFVQVGFFGTGK